MAELFNSEVLDALSPTSRIGDVENTAEKTYNAFEAVNSPPDPIGVASQTGRDLGMDTAAKDLTTQNFSNWNAPAPPPGALGDPAGYAAAHTETVFPPIDMPILAGLQVLLTPTEVNEPEVRYPAVEHAFESNYERGYQDVLTADFDRRLEEHFSPPGPTPEPIGPPSPIDFLVPPLTADPTPAIDPVSTGGYDPLSYDSGSYDPGGGGSFSPSDGGGSSGLDGGSSGGSSE